MNLKNLGLKEMSPQELSIVDGGGWFADMSESLGHAVGTAAGVFVGTVTVATHIVVDTFFDH